MSVFDDYKADWLKTSTCVECGGECPEQTNICSDCLAKLLDEDVMG